MKTIYGLQLYSVRDLVKQDMRLALKTVADIGYRGVEFAGFGGLTPDELKTELKKNNLIPMGTHTGLSALLPENIEDTIAAHIAIGCPNLAIPSADLWTKQTLDSTVETINAAQPLLDAAGITLHYHNHVREFQPNEDGQFPEAELLRRTQIHFEVDVCWAFVAGKDPVALLRQFGDRVSLIHLKDGTKDGHGTYLGRGDVPIVAVRDYALTHGIGMIVESEDQQPDGPSEVAACMDFLKTLE